MNLRTLASALCRTLCVFALAFLCLSSPAATVRYAFTNMLGQADTNWFLVYPVDANPVMADGSVRTIGPAIRLTPASNGHTTNTLEVGNYMATNRFLGRGLLFRVPNDHGPTVYCATCGTNNSPVGTGLAISGFNTFVTIVYGTNPPPTYDEITNSLGFLPVRSSQLNTNELFDLEGDLTVSGISHILVNPDDSLDATLNWADMTLNKSGSPVLDWFNSWLVGTWRANGALFTNLPQSAINNLSNSLVYLTNSITSGGTATNVIDVAAGINVTIITNGLLRTIAAAGATSDPNALTNYETRTVVFGGPNGVTWSMTNRGMASFQNGMILSNRTAPFEIRTADGVVQLRQQYNETGIKVTYIHGDGGGLTNLNVTSGAGSFSGTFSGNGIGLTNVPGPGIYAFPRPTTNVSDATSLIMAVNYSPPGTVVGIMPGTYLLGTNNLVPPDGVSVVGSGTDPHDVILVGYADCWGVETFSQASGGPQFSPGNNQFIGGFTLRCDTNTIMSFYPQNFGTNFPHSLMWSGFGMSRANPPTNRKSTNTVVRNLYIERGWFDAFHFNNDGSKQNEITFIDCLGENSGAVWDFWSATGGNTNSVYNLINCYAIRNVNLPQRIIDEAAYLGPALIGFDPTNLEGPRVYAKNFHGLMDMTGEVVTGAVIGPDGAHGLILDGGKITTVGVTNDFDYLKIAGSFSWNGTNINNSPRFNTATVGLQYGWPGLVMTNLQFPNSSLVWTVDLFDPSLYTLDFVDDTGPVSIWKIYLDKTMLGGNRYLIADGKGITNLLANAFAVANNISAGNGTAGQVLTSKGNGFLGWSNSVAGSGGSGIATNGGSGINNVFSNITVSVSDTHGLMMTNTHIGAVNAMEFRPSTADPFIWEWVYYDDIDGTPVFKWTLDKVVLVNRAYYGDGAGITNIPRTGVLGLENALTSLTNSQWKVTGNSGLTDGTHFLGTLDNVSLLLRSSNTTLAAFSGYSNTVNLGKFNGITGWQHHSAIGGGQGNSIFGPTNSAFHFKLGRNVIAGGSTNTIIGGANGGNFIGGGRNNLISDEEFDASTVVGGELNISSNSPVVFIGGGFQNVVGGPSKIATAGTIAGGYQNIIPGSATANATNEFATISGGFSNRASGAYSAIPGGNQNQASGSNSFAAGFRAQALHPGSTVFSDVSSATAFTSSANNEFAIRSSQLRLTNGTSASAGLTITPNDSFTTIANGVANGGSINLISGGLKIPSTGNSPPKITFRDGNSPSLNSATDGKLDVLGVVGISVQGYVLATNGIVLIQSANIPTNSILPSGSGTNWTLCNLVNRGPVWVATNTAAAGSFVIRTPTTTDTIFGP